MPNLTSRAAFVAAMMILPGAEASALTCAEDPARAETLAREATAIIVGRVTPAPNADPAPPIPAAYGGPISAQLTAFGAPPTPRALDVETIETLKGKPPAGVFRATFMERPCAPLPAAGKRRILYLQQDGDGWRVLGSN